MYSILDSTAEVIAIVLSWGNLGRGQFSSLVKDVKDALGKNKDFSTKRIMTVDDKYIEDIRNIIEKEIIEESNSEWYELFKLYRNKQSHFRRYSGFLLHDKEGNFYHFLPRQWPYYFQQDMAYSKNVKTNINLKDSLSELLTEQDIFEYCDGLHKKIFDLIDKFFSSLTEAYKIKKDSACEFDQNLQEKVELLTRKYKFKHF